LATLPQDSICYSSPDVWDFPHFSGKKTTVHVFGAGYPLVWYMLHPSVGEEWYIYFSRHYAAQQISTTIRLYSGE